MSLVIPLLVCYFAGAWMTYSKPFRESAAFLPSFVALTALSGLLWVLATRSASPRSILTLSALCDAGMIVAYYALPIAIFGVQANGPTVAGILFIVTGAVMVRLGEHGELSCP